MHIHHNLYTLYTQYIYIYVYHIFSSLWPSPTLPHVPGGTKPQCSALHQSAGSRHGPDHGAANGAIEFGQCHATVGTTGAGLEFHMGNYGKLPGGKKMPSFFNRRVESFESCHLLGNG